MSESESTCERILAYEDHLFQSLTMPNVARRYHETAGIFLSPTQVPGVRWRYPKTIRSVEHQQKGDRREVRGQLAGLSALKIRVVCAEQIKAHQSSGKRSLNMKGAFYPR